MRAQKVWERVMEGRQAMCALESYEGNKCENGDIEGCKIILPNLLICFRGIDVDCRIVIIFMLK